MTMTITPRPLLLFACWTMTTILTIMPPPPAQAQQVTSRLWGQNGEDWVEADDDAIGLRDFTYVGYMNGNVTIPDWPVGCNVLDFGAIPNDDGDDAQAFIDAIAACPPYTAIFVPVGRYIIRQQIRPQRDYFVLRGEDMYQTVLYMPQYLGEIYPAAYYDVSYGTKGGFFHVLGGTHRSIESLTFEFREQTKMGFWEFRGAKAMEYRDDVVDSWIRNIHFRNMDFGLNFFGAQRVSVLNLYFSHYIGRPAFVSSADYIRQAGYLGIGMGKMRQCLIHNVVFEGAMFHDLDIISVPSYNVVSRMIGPEVGLQHHGRGAHHNLYTDCYCGRGSGAHGLKDSRDMHHETYWGIHRIDRNWPDHPDGDFTTALNSWHTFVGYAVDYPNVLNSNTFYFENIAPERLTPPNIYLAQMELVGKPLPEPIFATPPTAPELAGDVRWLNPVHDGRPGNDAEAVSLGFDGYLQFDLRQLTDLSTIAHVRLRLCTRNRRQDTTFNFFVAPVDDDEWTQDSLETATEGPNYGDVLDSVFIEDTTIHKWWDFDVTDFVRDQWQGDQIVSFHVGNDANGFIGSFHSKESGNAPLLVIERVPSPVPGPPAAPTGMRTMSDNGHILLDWNDNTEADFAYYNVYRTPAPNLNHPVAQGLTISNYTDISATEDRGLCEMPDDVIYFYTITAVDTHGYESPHSATFVGNTLRPNNSAPLFEPGPHSLVKAELDQPYNTSIAGLATDAESDPLYYFIVSGPSWLHLSFDGEFGGTPQESDEGIFEVTIQVNAIGGRDETVFTLQVGSGVPPAPITTPGTPTPPLPATNERCEQHSACAVAGLVGACCPTVDGWTLDCCDKGQGGSAGEADDIFSLLETCNSHTRCDALGLSNTCCPTPTGVFLDCCERVPNECLPQRIMYHVFRSGLVGRTRIGSNVNGRYIDLGRDSAACMHWFVGNRHVVDPTTSSRFSTKGACEMLYRGTNDARGNLKSYNHITKDNTLKFMKESIIPYHTYHTIPLSSSLEEGRKSSSLS